MSFLQKALERGLTPSNVTTYLAHKVMLGFGGAFGSLRLHLKAFCFGVHMGSHVTAHGAVSLMRWPGSHITIGNDVSFISSWRRSTAAAIGHPVRLRTFYPSSAITIGDGSQLTGASLTCRSTSISLGRRVLVGPEVIITDSDFHAPWPVETRADDPGLDRDRPVSVGDGAWIGMKAVILKGVTIGEGAIIGAGSVVTKDVPAFAVAAGNPARVIRQCRADGTCVAGHPGETGDGHRG